jgi:hypothetical protein
MAKEGFGCGRPECKCSTTIADQASFGTGHLSDYGFFAEGCAICAAAWKKIHKVSDSIFSTKPKPYRYRRLFLVYFR